VIRIDLDDPRPIEDQLVAALRLALARREVAPGDALPAARQLAGDLGVHWNTVARAYRRLHDEGLIAVRQGRRTIVLEGGTDRSPAARATLRTELVNAITVGRLRGLSRRELTDVFKEALEHIQERTPS
jgi:GntR family transcriptional regulator